MLLNPGHLSARKMLLACYRFKGIEYYGLSRYRDAIDAWRKALKIEPENLEIQRFITRCEAEKRAIASIIGDSVAAVVTALSPKKPPPVHIDTIFITQPGVIDTVIISVEAPSNTTSRRGINFGLSSGIVIGTGNSQQPKTGMTFAGFLSVLPDRHRLGGPDWTEPTPGSIEARP